MIKWEYRNHLQSRVLEKTMKQSKETIELIKRAKCHDAEAFSDLVQLYLSDLYKVAISILMNDSDAADAIQDALLSCWEKIESLKNNHFFKTWLIRILINKCYDIRKIREKELTAYENKEIAVCDESNYEFQEMLSVLDDKYRIPMYLFYGEELKISEIANILDIPQSTVQTRLARGRDQLAKYYESETEGK